jgi:hypothetical protein
MRLKMGLGDNGALNDRREFRAARFSAKIQKMVFHGMIPFDWPQCGG